MKHLFIYIFGFCLLLLSSCLKSEFSDKEAEGGKVPGEEIVLSLCPSGEILQVGDEPLKAGLPDGTLYVVSVLRGAANYAHGVFSDPSAMSLTLITETEFTLKVKAVKAGVTAISHEGEVYAGAGHLDNAFHYYADDATDAEFYGNTSVSANGQPLLDTYYGTLTVTPAASTSSLEISLYRMMHTLDVNVRGFQTGDGDVTFTQTSYLPGTGSFSLSPAKPDTSFTAVINTDFDTVVAAISGAGDYSRSSTFTAEYSGESGGAQYTKKLLDNQSVTFRRNRVTSISIVLGHNYLGVPEPVPEGAVDLGLSVYWASYNLGASAPEAYGNYYAWGETTPKSSYSWTNYKYRVSGSTDDDVTFSRYCTANNSAKWGGTGVPDNKTEFSDYDYADDAARVNLGSFWRTPTFSEWLELCDTDNCSWVWTSLNGVDGYTVTSKKSGYTNQSIFIPAALDKNLPEYIMYGDYYGCYWTSSLNPNSSNLAHYIGFDPDTVLKTNDYRYSAFTIRPVYPK